MKVENAPDMDYVLRQGLQPSKTVPISSKTLFILQDESYPVEFGAGTRRRRHMLEKEHLEYIMSGTLQMIVAFTILAGNFDRSDVEMAEGIIRGAGHSECDLVVVTASGSLDPENPTRLRKMVDRSSSVARFCGSMISCNATELLQAVSLVGDVGIGVWREDADALGSELVISYKDFNFVYGFHSSVRRILSGGAKQAVDTLLPRNIRLDD